MQDFVGGTIPGRVVLDCVRKQAEKATGDKPVSSIPRLLMLSVPKSLHAVPVLTSLSDGGRPERCKMK